MSKELQDPLEELAREDEVAQRLVERLGEYGLNLRSGGDVTPQTISEGVRLLDRYRGLHAVRFGEDLLPEARRVAMPTCFEHLDAIARGEADATVRTARINAAVDAYARGGDGAKDQIAAELDQFTQQEYDRLRYERDYPLSCLMAALPDDAGARICGAFAKTGNELAQLERQIGDYLASRTESGDATDTVRSTQPDSSTTGSVGAQPKEDGGGVIRLPEGWSNVPHPPSAASGRAELVGSDRRSPPHAVGLRSVAEESPSPATTGGREPSKNCPCCQPIPGELA